MVARKIRKTDPHLCAAIEKEVLRQQQTLALIASENIVSAAVTSRGMGAPEIKIIGDGIVAVLQHPGDARVANRVRGTMRELCNEFPMATGAG